MPEQRELQQPQQTEELGDRKPSQLLRRFQQLLGDKAAAFDQDLFRELFLRRLPTAVCMVLVTASSLPVSQLAQLADSIMDASNPAVSPVERSDASTA